VKAGTKWSRDVPTQNLAVTETLLPIPWEPCNPLVHPAPTATAVLHSVGGDTEPDHCLPLQSVACTCTLLPITDKSRCRAQPEASDVFCTQGCTPLPVSTSGQPGLGSIMGISCSTTLGSRVFVAEDGYRSLPELESLASLFHLPYGFYKVFELW